MPSRLKDRFSGLFILKKICYNFGKEEKGTILLSCSLNSTPKCTSPNGFERETLNNEEKIITESLINELKQALGGQQ